MAGEWPTLLEWREPLWFWLALLPLVALVMQWRGEHRALARFAEPALHPWLLRPSAAGRGGWTRRLGWGLAWLLLVTALAGPQVPESPEVAPRAGGPPLLLLLDLSPSMGVRDVAPSRRERARIALGELLHHLQGEKLGLMPFAARPHLMVPPTGDREVFRFYLEALARLELPTAGSRPEAALEAAAQELLGRGGAVVLVTDGDFPDSDVSLLEERARDLADQGIPFSILRVATPSGGVVEDTEGRLIRRDGEPVISRPNLPLLDRLAEAGGGIHLAPEPDGSHWRRVLALTPEEGERGAEGSDHRVWHHLYRWPLAGAVGVLLLLSLPMRRAVTPLLLLLLSPPFPPTAAAGIDTPLPSAGTGGHDEELGRGVTLYRMEELGEAAHHFRRALLLADDDHQRAVALHDLGVVRYRQGDYAAAARLFEEALRHQPTLAPARHNLELADALARAVERREASGEVLAERMGHGARSLRARESMEAGDKRGSMNIDESSAEKPPLTLERILQGFAPAELEHLLRRGVERLRAGRSPATPADLQVGESAVRAAWLGMEGLDDHPERVWRRLFEMEEGFEAPREGPQPVEGVSPW